MIQFAPDGRRGLSIQGDLRDGGNKSEMMNFVLNMIDFVYKFIVFCISNDEFCTEYDNICIINTGYTADQLPRPSTVRGSAWDTQD